MNRPSKKRRFFIIFLALVLLAGGVVAAAYFAADRDSSESAEQSQAQDSDNPREVRFTASGDKSVLEQLQDHADVTTGDAGSGAYVYSINELESGKDDYYWSYYVNGKAGEVAESEYVPEPGEEIVWKYEKL